MQLVLATTTPQRHALRPAPTGAKPAGADLINQVSSRTQRTLYAAFLQVRGEDRGRRRQPCADAMDEFMNALYRVTEQGDVWRLSVLSHLAPVVFALDAQLDAAETGRTLSEEQVSAAINEALAAAQNTANWRL